MHPLTVEPWGLVLDIPRDHEVRRAPGAIADDWVVGCMTSTTNPVLDRVIMLLVQAWSYNLSLRCEHPAKPAGG